MRPPGATIEVMSNAQSNPYLTLGKHLRYLREQHKESLAEVSGAVEIDDTVLERIEAGHERPAEEILLLLISHFNMQDQEAVQLWELAGYDGSVPGQIKAEEMIAENGQKPVFVLFGIDNRTMYTDAVEIVGNNAGLTLSFSQQGANNQQMPVARVGMSYEQAEKVMLSLQRAMLFARYQNGPKALPPSTDTPDMSL